MDYSQRLAALASKAAAKPTGKPISGIVQEETGLLANSIMRDRWMVRRPRSEPMLVIVCPPQTAPAMRLLYPGAGILPTRD